MKKIFVLTLLISLLLISCADPGRNDTAAQTSVSSNMQVHYIDVGQGDCTLILCDGHAMLIDAGDNTKGTAVQLYLQKQGVTSLDYVIATHPDSDHIGGLDVIVTKFDCDVILMPDCTSDTASYRELIDAMNYRGYQSTLPVTGTCYSLGGASFTIIAPNNSDYGDHTNNYSIGIRLVHGKNSFLFTGDAEEEAERDILQNTASLQSDVLKVGHHGSRTSSSADFLNAAAPAYAVISCEEGNSYGHPHAEVLNRLRDMGVSVFRTDEQGTIIAISDQDKIVFNCAPSNSWQTGEPEDSSPSGVQTATYIINTNTGKFHYADCPSVEDMAEKNKLPSDQTREEIIAQGYVPCKICNP